MKRGLIFIFILASTLLSKAQTVPTDTTEMIAYIDSVLNETRGPIRRDDFKEVMNTLTRYTGRFDVTDADLGTKTDTTDFRDSIAQIRTDLLSYSTTAETKGLISDTADVVRAKSIELPDSIFYDPLVPRISEVEKYVAAQNIQENTEMKFFPPIKDYRQRQLGLGDDGKYWGFPVFMIGSQGEMFAYLRRGASHVDDGDAVFAWSMNGGASWDYSLVADWTGDVDEYGYAAGGLLERNDTIFATYRVCNSLGSGVDTCGMYYKHSVDRGKTWAGETYIPSPSTNLQIPGEIEYPTVSGRTFMPYYGNDTTSGQTDVYIGYFGENELFEDATWVSLDTTSLAVNETSIVVDGDSLFAFSRYSLAAGQVGRSYSLDNGITWSTLETTGGTQGPTTTDSIIASYPKPIVLPDGRYITTVRYGNRLFAAYQISNDRGKNWEPAVRIRMPQDTLTTAEGENEFMYGDFRMLTPSTLGLVFCMEGANKSSMFFTQFSVPGSYKYLKTKSGGTDLVDYGGGAFYSTPNIGVEGRLFVGGINGLVKSSEKLKVVDIVGGQKLQLGLNLDIDSGLSITQNGDQLISLRHNGEVSATTVSAGRLSNPTGPNASVYGDQSGNGSSASNLSTYGYQSSLNNNTDFSSSFGSQALSGNSGTGAPSAYGFRSLRNNTGNFASAYSYLTGNANSGDYVGFFGYGTGASNTFNGVYLFGHDLDADQSRQVKLGIGANVPAYSTQLFTVNNFDLQTDVTPSDGFGLFYDGVDGRYEGVAAYTAVEIDSIAISQAYEETTNNEVLDNSDIGKIRINTSATNDTLFIPNGLTWNDYSQLVAFEAHGAGDIVLVDNATTIDANGDDVGTVVIRNGYLRKTATNTYYLGVAQVLILTSPDGTEYELGVDNSGNLTTTPR